MSLLNSSREHNAPSFFQLIFYVPADSAEKVKNALFNVGAGKFGNYDMCSWESEGLGQFRPLKKSNPYIGTENKLEKVKELKIEMIVPKAFIKKVIEILIKAHPYEEPAFFVTKMAEY